MFKYFISLIVICLVYSTISFAYDNKKTHPSLTEKAVEHAEESNTFLKEQLGFTRGYTQFLSNGIKNRRITDWLQDGSKEEDEPNCRAANHFHDPLKPWKESQLTDPIWIVDRFCEATTKFRTKYSNISWATGIKNPAGAPMSKNVNGTGTGVVNGRNWFVARDFFYQALTETDPQQREAFFAETFHTLGYVLHLLEDMAVPAHTRNDFSEGHSQNIHCPAGGCQSVTDWIGNPYEGYVRDNFDVIYSAIPGADRSVSFTGEKKLTNFWDTEIFTPGAVPPVGTTQGLAEYTNSNFLSQATIFKEESDDPLHYYQYPSMAGVTSMGHLDKRMYEFITADGKTDKGVYITKTGQGEDIQFFLKPRYLPDGSDWDTYTPDLYKLKLTLDNQCYKDYAKKLLPRAIGYSAGLLDYFFRGKLEVVGLPMFTSNHYSNRVGLRIKNNTSTQETMSDGVFSIVMHFPNVSGQETYIRAYADLALTREEIEIDKLEPGQEKKVYFYLPMNASSPQDPSSIRYTLSYKGKLGEEEGAVIGKEFKLESEYIVLSLEDGKSVIVWDPVVHGYAPIRGDNGTFVNFPCAADEISGWLNSVTKIGYPYLSMSILKNGNIPVIRAPPVEEPLYWPVFNDYEVENNAEVSAMATMEPPSLNPFNNLTNDMNSNHIYRVEVMPFSCNGGSSSNVCNITTDLRSFDYNYAVDSYRTYSARKYDQLFGSRITKKGILERFSLNNSNVGSCNTSKNTELSSLDRYTKTWITPLGKLGERSGTVQWILRAVTPPCYSGYPEQTWQKIQDRSIDQFIFKNIATDSTQVAVWVLTLLPSSRERLCSGSDIAGSPIHCNNETIPWGEDIEDRQVLVHAHDRFSERDVFLDDPFSGGRDTAFEEAIREAYVKAFSVLGVADDKNPLLEMTLRVVKL